MDAPAAPGPGNWLLTLCLGFLWGASFMGAKLALADFGPLTVAAFRVALAAVILIAAAHALGAGLPALRGSGAGRLWLFCLGMGVFSNALPFFLLNWAQQTVASAFAGVCMAAVPLFVLPMAHLLVPGEAMTLRKGAGFVTGFAGVALLLGPGALAAVEGGGGRMALARLACLGAAACYATGSIVTRRAPPANRISFGAGALLLAALILLPAALAVEGVPAGLHTVPVLGLLYLGLGPTALATLILVQVIRTAGPSFLSLTNYMVPLWSVALGTAFLGETLPPQFLAALGLILAGLAISQWRGRNRRAAAPR